MRRYGVLPSQVVATGPRGHVLKGDVLKYVEDNKLQQRDLKSEPVAAPQKEQAKVVPQAAPPKKQLFTHDQTASPVYDPNNPFQQIWSD